VINKNLYFLGMSMQQNFCIQQSLALDGTVHVSGAKNAVLVAIASLLLVKGKSVLYNVPHLQDIWAFKELLEYLGAVVEFDPEAHIFTVDATNIDFIGIPSQMMKKTRASILILGPLLARLKKVQLSFPGGDAIGARPIDFHLQNFEKMGAIVSVEGDVITVQAEQLHPGKFVLDYPSVGATENILMAAVCVPGTSTIVNAALEPEVLDLIKALRSMGAFIDVQPARIIIQGGTVLRPVHHTVMYDRLEVGTYLLAAAITGGSVYIPNADACIKEIFLSKLQDMGHKIGIKNGIYLKATQTPKAVSVRTEPYPGFPTDLQPFMMVAQMLASGSSVVHETVYENRFLHVPELIKMGAQVEIKGNKAFITGVQNLQGMHVQGDDIRAVTALVLAGLVAQGQTVVSGISHLRRGYEQFEEKMRSIGAQINLQTESISEITQLETT
jgi:UDP-N-acetylglucosamine 1-carboxyvinyltransferase